MADRKPERRIEYRGTGLYISLAVVLVLVLAVFILAVQNTESVDFEFLGWDLEVPLFALIIAGGLIAVVIDELIGLAWRRSRRRRLTERKELQELRTRYVAGDAAEDEPATVSNEDERKSP